MGSALLSFLPRDPGWPGMPSTGPGSSPAPAPLPLPRCGPVQPHTSVSPSGHCARAWRRLSTVTAPSPLSQGWGPQHLWGPSYRLRSAGKGGPCAGTAWPGQRAAAGCPNSRAPSAAAAQGRDTGAIGAAPASPSSALSRRRMERLGPCAGPLAEPGHRPCGSRPWLPPVLVPRQCSLAIRKAGITSKT